MPYALGIDLGSGHLAAAICRNDRERWSEPEVLALDGLAVTEAVLHLTDEGTVEVGDRALQHVTTRPDRVTRGFVDRVGDEIPITLGGQPYPAEVLIAAVVGWIADYAEASEGMPASQLVVTHPAGWGTHRRTTLQGALREVGLPELTLLPRPVAAAESYAAKERVEVGQEIAVHSLGAGRFESAVLRRGSFGFELRAHADAGEQAGGDLFDDLLAAHVLADLGHDVEPVALAKLRVACRTAKERLSTELAVTVPAPARSPRGTVMVNRTDVEELIRPAVEATVASLQRTIQSTSTGSLQAVVLVGGCGRIPLVSELVSAGVRVRVVAAADPELSVARGAALAAARVAKPTVKAPALASARSTVAHTDLMRFDDVPEEAQVADVGPPPPRPPVEITPLEPPKRRVLGLGSRGGEAGADLRDEEPRAARVRPRRTELSGADLFAPLDDSSPALFTHGEDSAPESRADKRRRDNSDLRRDLRRRIRGESQQNLHPEPTYGDDQDPGRDRDDVASGSRQDIRTNSRYDMAPDDRYDLGSEDFGSESRHDISADSRRDIRRQDTGSEAGYAADPGRQHNTRSERQHPTDSEARYAANPGSRHNTPAERRPGTGPDSRGNIRADSRHRTGPESEHDILADGRHTDSERRRDHGPGSQRDLSPKSRYDLGAEIQHDAGPNSRRNIRADNGYDIGPDNRHDLEFQRDINPESRPDIHADRRPSLGAEGRHDPGPDSRHNLSPESRYDIRTESRHTDSEGRNDPGTESRRAKDRHDTGPDNRHNLDTESRRNTRTEDRHDVGADSRHSLSPESRRTTRTESRYDVGADSRHGLGTENRHAEGRHDTGADNRHNLGSDSRRNIRAEGRHDIGADGRHEPGSGGRHDIRADGRRDVGADNRHIGSDGRYDVGSGSGRGFPAASRHEGREGGYRPETGQDGHRNGEYRREVPQEGSHRSRHEGGRRHRTDDRAFNESLTRARHGDGEDLR